MDRPGFTSLLFDLDPIDQEDELDLELSRCYNQYCNDTRDKSERELHNYLQEKASKSKPDYKEIVSALLYGLLTNPESAQRHFQSISLVNRDQYTMLISLLNPFVTSTNFTSIKQKTKDQLLWLCHELTNLNIPYMESIYLYLLRQIKAGDTSPPNTRLCDQLLRLLETHRSWLDSYPRLLMMAVYTYLRLIPEHRPMQLATLQQKEIRFVITILRQKWHICIGIGRDLIRGLQDVYHLPDFTAFWADLLDRPHMISPNCQGIENILKTPTPKDFLRARLTPDMEQKLMYILQNLRIGQYQRNLNWFTQRFLSTSDAEPFYADVIRFIVAGWYPNNQILQSDIVPRYVVIGTMIRTIKNPVVAANVKMALIYDWLFFTPNENIMFIEPAMLLMERSVERYPYITSSLLEFIQHTVNEYHKPMYSYMMAGVKCGMQMMLSKTVIRSLSAIYRFPSIDDYTRNIMQQLFAEFLTDVLAPTQQPLSTVPPTQDFEGAATDIKDKIGTQDQAKAGNSVEPVNITNGSVMRGENSDAQEDVQSTPLGNDEPSKDTPMEHDSRNETTTDQDDDIVMAPEPSPHDSDALSGSTSSNMETSNNVSAATTKTTTELSISDLIQQQFDQFGDDSGSNYSSDDDDSSGKENTDQGMQSNQSYWIFGDALNRFKTSCSTLLSSQLDVEDEEFSVQLIIAKRSLKEILAVFLRMSIPAETLAPSIASPILKLASSLLLENAFTRYGDDMTEDGMILDTTKDSLDLVLVVFWNNKEDAATRERMIHLLGYLMHQCRTGKKHIVGMRWWHFIAGQLKTDNYLMDEEPSDWTSLVATCYEEFALQGFDPETDGEEVDYFGHYLWKDLKLLSKYNVESFCKVIPFVYRRFNAATMGNVNLLNLISRMLLPDQIGELVCLVKFKSIRIFGDRFDTHYLDSSFDKSDIYAASSIWQLLNAEVQVSSELANHLSTSDFIRPLKDHFRLDLIPLLMTILSGVPPTQDLLRSIVQISSQKQANYVPRLQFSLVVLKTWHDQYSDQLHNTLVDWFDLLLDELDGLADDSNDELQNTAAHFIRLLRLWWTDSNGSLDLYLQDRALMVKLSKIAATLSQSWPKEWTQETTTTTANKATTVTGTRKKARKVVESSDEESD